MHMRTNDSLQNVKMLLKMHLLTFYPDEYIEQFIATPKDIYENRFLLRGMAYTSKSFMYLVQIVTEAVLNSKRFRVYYCIKALRDILPVDSGAQVEKDTLDKLFYLFQELIFHTNPEVQRHVNNLIRNQLLDDGQISWLIEHYKRSPHIVNRLLRYPVANKQVADWARAIYETDELADRTAELISILITDTLPELHVDEDINTILWAIYYSKNTNNVKKRLLLGVLNSDNIMDGINNIVGIAKRMNCGSLLKDVVEKYG